MRIAAIALTALLSFGATVSVVQAQSTRSEELPGNNPIAAFSMDSRNYVRTYMRDRMVPSVGYSGRIAIGGRLPASVTIHRFEGDAAYADYRYGRVDDRYVVIDQDGRILEIID